MKEKTGRPVNKQDLSGSSDEEMDEKKVKHLSYRPNYVISESMPNNQQKYFYCVLYFPLTCTDKGITKVNPNNAYPKKKDAENHVALLAFKRLIDKGFFDNYFFPVPTHPSFKGCLGA